MTAAQFEAFANSLPNGFLKTWKANSMIGQIQMYGGVEQLGLEWVENCLLMEGFTNANCIEIYKFLRDTK
jgi:hypothetical protein